MPEQTQLWRLVEAWRRRQRFNVSQSALARDIGVARGAISQWKYGESRPSPDHMRALQSATGIRYRDLLDAMLTDMGYLRGSDDGGRDTAPIADEDAMTERLRRTAREATPETPRAPARPRPRNVVDMPDRL